MSKEINSEQMDNFLHNIAWLRQHYGFSKRKMAKILHIGIPSLNKIERGECPERLSSRVAFYIRDYFHIPVPDLWRYRLDEWNDKK